MKDLKLFFHHFDLEDEKDRDERSLPISTDSILVDELEFDVHFLLISFVLFFEELVFTFDAFFFLVQRDTTGGIQSQNPFVVTPIRIVFHSNEKRAFVFDLDEKNPR